MATGKVSLVLPEAGINLITNPSFEYGTTGWTAVSATIGRSAAQHMFGVSSLEVVTANAAANEGAYDSHNPGAAGTFTASAYVYGASGTVRIRLRDQTNGTETSSSAVTLAGAWQRITVTHTTGGVCADLRTYVETDAQQNITYYVDGVQLEESSYYTTYIDGTQRGCAWYGAKHVSASYRSGQSRAGGRIHNLDSWSVIIDTLTGVGMPPVRHNVQQLAQQPGASLQGVKVEPRVLQLKGHTDTASESTMYAARKEIIDALKDDLVATTQPVILQYSGTGTDLWCYCVYDAGLEAQFDTTNYNEFTIRLIAYDPYWYAVGNDAMPLPVSESMTLRYCAGRLRDAGQWDDLGLTANPAMGGTVYAIARGPDGKIYFGGWFTNWNGAVGRDYIAAYDPTTDTWETVGGASDFNDVIWTLLVAPDGTLYAGGNFTLLGGGPADYLAQWDGTTWSAVSAGGTGQVYALAMGEDGTLYIGGSFVNWNGDPDSDYIVSWTGAAYAPLGTGRTAAVFALAVVPDGALYVGGAFNVPGGDAYNYICKWASGAWSAVGGGMDDVVYALAADDSGRVCVGGAFHTAGTVSAAHIAMWTGQAWKLLGAGVNGTVRGLTFMPDGTLYVTGLFTSAGGLTLAQRAARWNGYSGAALDVLLFGAPVNYAIACGAADPVMAALYDVYVGCDTNGLGQSNEATAVTNGGQAEVYPTFEVYNSGSTTWPTLGGIRNETTGDAMLFDLTIMGGETVTIDLTPGGKRITSDWRGNIIGKLLRGCNFSSWRLLPGSNNVSVWVRGSPQETGDDNTQLGGWEYVNGVSTANTDRGRLYVSIVADGGGFYHVNLYKDSGRTLLVGHTASYNGVGVQDIVADNSSGLSGCIVIGGVVGADVDIVVYYTICDLIWRPAYHGVSGSV
jgi:hypothetical protein